MCGHIWVCPRHPIVCHWDLPLVHVLVPCHNQEYLNKTKRRTRRCPCKRGGFQKLWECRGIPRQRFILLSEVSCLCGRRPGLRSGLVLRVRVFHHILLSGTLGILVANILFGLSRSFWSLALRYRISSGL